VNKAFHAEFGDSVVVHWNDQAGRCHVWQKPKESVATWTSVGTSVN
jgi:hypothetical protein